MPNWIRKSLTEITIIGRVQRSDPLVSYNNMETTTPLWMKSDVRCADLDHSGQQDGVASRITLPEEESSDGWD
ncbi:hypothetical protein C7121_23130 [Paenibacillus glucanolyticus]|jgi:hypothetical protein|uniref:hypothetical protein n=1 Tax=Paenibacillus TaxID=44249 RepID=UPI0003E248DB|nr:MULTISPECIES: hypothetical protein [Paenibacillus]ANA82457.1 hypothetical protein A3958_21865 [Paenibacillus glucanolyticus]AVV58805.1 hypothetical protein C7121_23130 [Paenibacillus glucanolyticus]ETT33840.1 hypothetical protein C169_21488 [Paenibacillus sp. FSL R5-808]MPY17230.1 hypothetical protein [Paenibacillus glucanolyticus]